MDIPENVVEAAKRWQLCARRCDPSVTYESSQDMAEWIIANAPDPRIEVVRRELVDYAIYHRKCYPYYASPDDYVNRILARLEAIEP